MRKDKAFRVAMAVFVALMLVALVGLSLAVGPAAPVAADTVPTPISNPATSDDAVNAVFWSEDALTASEGSNALQLVKYEFLDLQYVIDQTDVNTVSLKMQFSNDPLCVTTPASATWSDGVAVVADNAEDADSILQTHNMGRCTRLYATVTNSNEVTLTVRAVAK